MVAQRKVTETTLKRGKPMLIVSLPRNDVVLAQAAQAAGADALKVHINVQHHASGTYFGTLADERAALVEIIDVGLPVGIVPGADAAMATQQDMWELDELGVDFFDAYVHHMPVWMLQMETAMSRMLALSCQQRAEGYSLGPHPDKCAIIEASVIAPDGYGQPLTAADLCEYEKICCLYPEIPVLVPTQCKIQPHELPALLKVGISGIIIGAVVTGGEASGIHKVTQQFVEVLRNPKDNDTTISGRKSEP